MNPEEIVASLIAARLAGTPVAVPLALKQDVPAEQAYAMQSRHIAGVLASRGGQVTGTKIAGGDLATMATLGLSGPMRGPIFSHFTYASPATLPRSAFLDLCLIEAEIALVLQEDLGGAGPAPGRAALKQAIGAIIPSIEVADSRYLEPGSAPPMALIADLAAAGAWVSGPTLAEWQGIDLANLEVRLLSNGEVVRSGTGHLAMGDPIAALEAMVNDLARSGEKLSAGQVVLAGSYTAGYLAKAGETLVADFGQLGQVSVSFE
jgi:2-keto-4-pentenoate hydratase